LLIDPSAPIAPPAVVPLALAGISLPLCTNVIVTTLIAIRIWHLSPREARYAQGIRFPTDTGRAAIDIVVESGLLYLIVQLIFVILFAIHHPAECVISFIAVQVYVRNRCLVQREKPRWWNLTPLHRASHRR
jgi:hypothetical protein